MKNDSVKMLALLDGGANANALYSDNLNETLWHRVFTSIFTPKLKRANDSSPLELCITGRNDRNEYLPKNPIIVRELLAHGANPNVSGAGGFTPLMSSFGNPGIPSILIEYGADLNARSDEGETPLMRAAYLFDDATIKSLLEHGARVNDTSKSGVTALYICAVYDDANAVMILLQYGADPNIKNIFGETAIAIAKKRHNFDTVALLKKAGAKEEK